MLKLIHGHKEKLTLNTFIDKKQFPIPDYEIKMLQ